MPSFRHLFSLLAAALLVSPPSFAFDSPLSDEAVREAYFLGQRHDGSSALLLEKYTKRLPLPPSGPHISSISFVTPFVQLAQFCDQYVGNYTAQRAALDHRTQEEFVRIIIEIRLTSSYGAFLADETDSRPGSPAAPIRRPSDFWKGFQVRTFNGNEALAPSSLHGASHSDCGRRGGPCILTGATLELDFPAGVFKSDEARVEVIPPEGDPVSVDFDLTRLR